jgi:hypothetical protein
MKRPWDVILWSEIRSLHDSVVFGLPGLTTMQITMVIGARYTKYSDVTEPFAPIFGVLRRSLIP